jgi:hypothetical protein
LYYTAGCLILTGFDRQNAQICAFARFCHISEVHLFFWAGKARDGYFDNDDLIREVDKAIDIFKGKTNGFATGLFLFDNAPSHQKCAENVLSAQRMPKGPHTTWRHHLKGPKMW